MPRRGMGRYIFMKADSTHLKGGVKYLNIARRLQIRALQKPRCHWIIVMSLLRHRSLQGSKQSFHACKSRRGTGICERADGLGKLLLLRRWARTRYKKAFAYAKGEADQGHAKAQLAAGKLCGDGEETNKDLMEAF